MSETVDLEKVKNYLSNVANYFDSVAGSSGALLSQADRTILIRASSALDV